MFHRRDFLAGAAAFAAEASRARAAGADADLARTAGAMVMMGFRGADPSSSGARFIADQLAARRIGGVLLFEDNCTSPDAVRALTGFFRAAAGATPILIGIDQEGGIVSRLRPERGFRAIPAADVVARMSPGEASAIYEAGAAELRGLGITLNFAPVVDLDRNPENPIIGALGRSYGADPDRVAAFATIAVEAHRRHGVLTSLKHFPGHGSSREDSHRALPDITQTWSDEELRPFARLVEAGLADTVMVGHLIASPLTEPGRPASLSRKAIEDRLRRTLGFSGVVVSDDMQMGALRRTFTPDEAIRMGIGAGLDLLLFSNREHPDPGMPERFHRVVAEGIASGQLSRERIARSARRIEELMRRSG